MGKQQKPKKKNLPDDFAELLEVGDIKRLKKLFNKYDPNAVCGVDKRTALGVPNMPDELVRWLVAEGADVNARNGLGQTPLCAGNVNIALLLELGADIEAKCMYSYTPLHFAAARYEASSVRTLLEFGADMNVKNDDGCTPLDLALLGSNGCYITPLAEISELFLSRGQAVTQEMRDLVTKIGRKIDFRRDRFNEDVLLTIDFSLNKMYELFNVKPVPPRQMHDGVSPIVVKDCGWRQQHEQLWYFLVPNRGRPKTIQGEVIRLTGLILDEVEEEGANCWNEEYTQWLSHLDKYFQTGTPLAKEHLKMMNSLLGKLSEDDDCGSIDVFCQLAVKWVKLNPNPIELDQTEEMDPTEYDDWPDED
jgi:hypothetical protein